MCGLVYTNFMINFDVLSVMQALILALVEGLTEFLPISSTGHLILTTKFMGIADSDFVTTFNIVIQLGAVLAIVLLYKDKLLQGPKVWKNIVIAFIPTGIIGLTVYRVVKDVLLAHPLNAAITVSTLFAGGVLILLLEKYYFPKRLAKSEADGSPEIEDISIKQALALGTIQTLAVVPGVSRSGATIFGGMALGLNRQTATQFSFLLAIPTMLAASGYDLLKSGTDFSSDEFGLLAVGFVGAFVFAYIVAKWFLKFVQSHTFVIFGWYRIVMAVVMYWLLLS